MKMLTCLNGWSILLLVVFVSSLIAVGYTLCCAKLNTKEKDYIEISNRLSAFFRSVDERNWDLTLDIFDEQITADYSSFTGIEASTLASKDLVDAWKGFIPKFDATHHQVGTVEIYIDGDKAKVKCYGTATHVKKGATGGDTQQVIGTYDIDWVKLDSTWKIKSIKLNFDVLIGNPSLLD